MNSLMLYLQQDQTTFAIFLTYLTSLSDEKKKILKKAQNQVEDGSLMLGVIGVDFISPFYHK